MQEEQEGPSLLLRVLYERARGGPCVNGGHTSGCYRNENHFLRLPGQHTSASISFMCGASRSSLTLNFRFIN